MSDFWCNEYCENKYEEVKPLDESLLLDEDVVMEQILENINSTPIGRVLKRIASLPEVRRNKVLSLRRQINQGEYDLNERMDRALEKVLDKLNT
ncbi:flagellar biosynthesis anti-sigma factor FlgM [Planctomycetota bacterium]